MFAEKLQRLLEILDVLEHGSISLETALNFCEEGAKLVRDCKHFLGNTQQVVCNLHTEAENQ